jgi:hypothetical protein
MILNVYIIPKISQGAARNTFYRLATPRSAVVETIAEEENRRLIAGYQGNRIDRICLTMKAFARP